MTTTATDIAEAIQVNAIIEPWLPINPERMLWVVTLSSGREITVCCPLGAAVEVETAGYHIRAGVADLPTEAPVVDPSQAIIDAHRAIIAERGGDHDDWVDICTLRQRAGLPAADFDAAILGLSRTRRANLVPLANQKVLTAADREAAVRVGGEDCHLVSMPW